MIFRTLSQLGYESQKYVISQAEREKRKDNWIERITLFIQQMNLPGLQKFCPLNRQ